MKREDAKAVIAALVTLRESATDEQALKASCLYPAWRVGVEYKVGMKVLWEKVLYKVLTAHTSQEGWAPDASPSLFAKVLIPEPSVIPEWEQPESTNGYMTDDKVKHNGKTWVSLVDNNVWEPSESVPDLWRVANE
jgi:hypothetical protein